MSFLERLANPPSGEALLEYSDTYKAKKAEIEAKLAAIADPGLRDSASSEEWAKVDKDALKREAEPKARVELVRALHACFSRHRNDWFEIGHPSYSSQNNVSVARVAASPIEWDSSMGVPVDVQTMDRVYSGFRDTTKQQTDELVQEWAYAQSCRAKVMNVCRNLGGQCSDSAQLAEAQQLFAQSGGYSDCNDNPSLEEGRSQAEQKMRGQRLILVGQGDLIAHRIEQLLIVDYDTETIYLKLDPKVLAGTDLRWRFSSLPGVDTVSESGLSQPVGDRPDQLNNPATPVHN
jgi:hypothetical protein